MKRSIDECFYYTSDNVSLSIIHSMRHAGSFTSAIKRRYPCFRWYA